MEQTSPALKTFLNDIGVGTTPKSIGGGNTVGKQGRTIYWFIEGVGEEGHERIKLTSPFWDYCLERRVHIYNMTVRDYPTIRGMNPHTLVTGEEGDISNLCQFSWYEWVYFRKHTTAFPHNKEVLGCVLGPARGAGNEMAQWILKANGRVVPRRSVRPLHPGELTSPSEQSKRQSFDALIERRYEMSINPLQQLNNDDRRFKNFEPYEDDDEAICPEPEIEDTVNATGRLLNQSPAYDRMLNAEVWMQLDDVALGGRVNRRALGPE